MTSGLNDLTPVIKVPTHMENICIVVVPWTCRRLLLIF